MRFRAFLERVGPRILSLERVDNFRTSKHFSARCFGALTKKTSYIRNLMLNKVPEKKNQACVLVEFVNEQVFKNNTRKIDLLNLESQEQIFIITPPHKIAQINLQ